MVVLGGAVSCERGNPVVAAPWCMVAQGGLMRSERKHSLSTEQFPVSAYVGTSKNLTNALFSLKARVLLGNVTSLLLKLQGYLAHKKTHPP